MVYAPWKIAIAIASDFLRRKAFASRFCNDENDICAISLDGGSTMLGVNLSDQIPGGPNLTLTLTLNSN